LRLEKARKILKKIEQHVDQAKGDKAEEYALYIFQQKIAIRQSHSMGAVLFFVADSGPQRIGSTRKRPRWEARF